MHKRAMGAVAVTGIAALLMSACGGSSTPAAKPSANTALAPTAPTTMSALVSTGQALVKSGKATNILLQEVGKVGTAFYTYPLPQGL